MCFTQQAYHSLCGHWARYPEFTPGGKCAIAELIPGWSKGCAHQVSYGMVTRNTLCAKCLKEDSPAPVIVASSDASANSASGSDVITKEEEKDDGIKKLDCNAFNALVKKHADIFSRSETDIFTPPSTVVDEDDWDIRPRQDSMFSNAEEKTKDPLAAVLDQTSSFAIFEPFVLQNPPIFSREKPVTYSDTAPAISDTIPVKDALDDAVDFLFAVFG
ncbi:hypothetical protein MBLNU459_g0675t2 [Dothideomycetes sp. NU459]